MLENNDIKIEGIILNNYDETDFMQVDNKIQIEKLTDIKVIATVQHNANDIEDLRYTAGINNVAVTINDNIRSCDFNCFIQTEITIQCNPFVI